MNQKKMNENSTNLERAQQVLVHIHHGSGVVKLATVVGRGEDRHETATSKEFISIFHYLKLFSLSQKFPLLNLLYTRRNVPENGLVTQL